MNREDLDLCTAKPDCSATEHVIACPADRDAPPRPEELGDNYGAWVVYDYDHGPYAIALYANAEAAARHAARQGYGRVGFWRYGTELTDAVRRWEGRPDKQPTDQLHGRDA